MATSPLTAPVESDRPPTDVAVEEPTLLAASEPTGHHRPTVDWQRSGLSTADKLGDATTAVVAAPVFVVACIAGAIGLAVGGAIALGSQMLEERRYRAAIR